MYTIIKLYRKEVKSMALALLGMTATAAILPFIIVKNKK